MLAKTRRIAPSFRLIFASFVLLFLTNSAWAWQATQAKRKQKSKPKASQPFRWVNPLKQELPGVTHATFRSPSMGFDVGYCIFLPPGYKEKPEQRYPVVYYLHGGRPGSEIKSVRLATFLQKHMQSGAVSPMIYVFVNGGPVSHYNMVDRENAMGEDVFVKELIPHIDATYRTIAQRNGRGIEGFSQGGRGTTRIMFKHPDLFCSAAPGGAGYATEKRISEENGRERANLVFSPGDNTWDLARKYAQSPQPPLRILIHVGTKGFNYENNLEYMKFLQSLKIPFEKIIVPDVPHSAYKIYEKRGLDLMKFHAASFQSK
ncbi:alpha/beta hydrolase [Thalassoroseus pseudoceratinae]|uniref:alpha/beta hydrolase n=1 Tax=Thalassoroseus pseudoceratinae TaxID=2713176 RepID=UPI0014228407|nr:alpha/beta hydrolase-fold protein [Thalassoroseus pseudoceratinae]